MCRNVNDFEPREKLQCYECLAFNTVLLMCQVRWFDNGVVHEIGLYSDIMIMEKM